jgi:polyamine oxidase
VTFPELSRRRFLQLAGAGTIAAAGGVARAGLPLVDLDRYDDGNRAIPGGIDGDPEHVIVIGAGFAGLAVANALRNAGVPCVVLEGRDRLGGRAHTVDVGDAPIDLGCSWITDPVGNPMTRFATRSGVLQTNAAIELDVPTSRFYDARTGVVLPPATGAAASHAVLFEQEAPGISRALGPLASIKDGIESYSSKHRLKGDRRRRGEFFMRLVTELPDATDWEKNSLAAWAGYESPYYGFGQGDFPRGGYRQIVRSLGAGADVRFGLRVTDVVADRTGVCVRTRDPSGRLANFAGSHAVVTVPLGVLKSRSISFAPELPAAKLEAIDRLGFGVFEKVVMRFPEPYWATEHTHIFYLSHPDPMRFPLIIDYFHLEGVPALGAFNVGRNGTELAGLTDREIQERMLGVLREVQGGSIPRPTDVAITRWSRDAYARGSYSYIPVGASGADQWTLADPVGGRILFAGEATSAARYGYADGALTTGIREAKRLLRRSAVELTPA